MVGGVPAGACPVGSNLFVPVASATVTCQSVAGALSAPPGLAGAGALARAAAGALSAGGGAAGVGAFLTATSVAMTSWPGAAGATFVFPPARFLVAPWRADTTPRPRWRADTAPRAQWRPDATRTVRWGQDVTVQQDLSMYQGEDVTITFPPASPGGPISGWTLAFAVKSAPGGTVQFTKTPTITDGPNGIITVAIASADTASLAAGVYWYELRRTDPGAVTELTVGNLTLQAR